MFRHQAVHQISFSQIEEIILKSVSAESVFDKKLTNIYIFPFFKYFEKMNFANLKKGFNRKDRKKEKYDVQVRNALSDQSLIYSYGKTFNFH